MWCYSLAVTIINTCLFRTCHFLSSFQTSLHNSRLSLKNGIHLHWPNRGQNYSMVSEKEESRSAESAGRWSLYQPVPSILWYHTPHQKSHTRNLGLQHHDHGTETRSRQTSRDLFTDNRTTSVSRSRVTDPKSTTKPARKQPPPAPRHRAAARGLQGPALLTSSTSISL